MNREQRKTTSIRLSERQREKIEQLFDGVQSFVDEMYLNIEDVNYRLNWQGEVFYFKTKDALLNFLNEK